MIPEITARAFAQGKSMTLTKAAIITLAVTDNHEIAVILTIILSGSCKILPITYIIMTLPKVSFWTCARRTAEFQFKESVITLRKRYAGRSYFDSNLTS